MPKRNHQKPKNQKKSKRNQRKRNNQKKLLHQPKSRRNQQKPKNQLKKRRNQRKKRNKKKLSSQLKKMKKLANQSHTQVPLIIQNQKKKTLPNFQIFLHHLTSIFLQMPMKQIIYHRHRNHSNKKSLHLSSFFHKKADQR